MRKNLGINGFRVGLWILLIGGLFLGAILADEISILNIDHIWIRAGLFGLGVAESARFLSRYGHLEIGKKNYER